MVTACPAVASDGREASLRVFSIVPFTAALPLDHRNKKKKVDTANSRDIYIQYFLVNRDLA